MPALVTVARNGTVSIIRDLTEEEAEKAKDVALDGPRQRKRERLIEIQRERVENDWRIAKLYFDGNRHAEKARIGGWDYFRSGQAVSANEPAYVVSELRLAEPGDIIQAEII